ncbi:PQQ-dependent sugar dehydrogenase [Pistricoccus aurantiacus]|uniref:PQQ-dependent sugar dehydrogenase n=1 Tax=Pistricoccus aurantiacus TaxID=1883414 RepID=UPI003627ED2A
MSFLQRFPGLCCLLGVPAVALAQGNSLDLEPVRVQGADQTLMAPAGATIEKLADLSEPRLISIGADDEMFIGSNAGTVYRLTPPYTEPQVLAEIGGYPHSVVRRGERLFVATTNALLSAPYQTGASLSTEDFQEVAPVPGGGGHSSRTLTVGPDERLYLSLGIQGNCSDQYIDESYDFADRRGGVMVLNEEGDSNSWQPYATGLRNPIGLAWHEGDLYAINNGPDHWGFEEPREVLVRTQPGSFHGMPWFQWVDGKFQRDDCISAEPPRPASDASEPVATLPARSAPMDLTFLAPNARLLPPSLGLSVDGVAAVHGSWATRPQGSAYGDPGSKREPRLVGIRLESPDKGDFIELVSGFQNDRGERWARPVGVATGPDSALYFTSDSGDTGLYRLRFESN